MNARFAIEPLAKAHKRSDFTCGNDRIDDYFHETVSQDDADSLLQEVLQAERVS